MKEIRITDKFSFAGKAILVVSEDIPNGIWIGDKAKIADETYTITGMPISDNRTFVIADTGNIKVNQAVEFYKG